MHIGRIETRSTDDGETWSAHVDLRVVDADGDPVPDAVVTAIWTGGALGVGGGVTGDAGRCRVSLRGIRGRTRSVTFTLSELTHPGHRHRAERDHGSDGTGTSVVVQRPVPRELGSEPRSRSGPGPENRRT